MTAVRRSFCIITAGRGVQNTEGISYPPIREPWYQMAISRIILFWKSRHWPGSLLFISWMNPGKEEAVNIGQNIAGEF